MQPIWAALSEGDASDDRPQEAGAEGVANAGRLDGLNAWHGGDHDRLLVLRSIRTPAGPRVTTRVPTRLRISSLDQPVFCSISAASYSF